MAYLWLHFRPTGVADSAMSNHAEMRISMHPGNTRTCMSASYDPAVRNGGEREPVADWLHDCWRDDGHENWPG